MGHPLAIRWKCDLNQVPCERDTFGALNADGVLSAFSRASTLHVAFVSSRCYQNSCVVTQGAQSTYWRPQIPGSGANRSRRVLLSSEVSSCEIELAEDAVAQITALNTYFPFVVIDSSGEIIGFAELYCLPHLGRRCDARLERVVVDETHRGKGIASALCVHILQLAEGVLHCGRVDLTVEKDNARHIYEDKLGFEQIQTTVMRKKFGAASAASPSHK
eukprot:GHVU01108836.1.p1 GENE.GHVU01108836.1~~GHVU01108836.1.p1  ORF type:complete len:218 (+),score=21.87 GHVU01108836.1:317-970(+)